jgi:murein DD-endopeptidase MepM/ murein hydrolase activator NlpD
VRSFLRAVALLLVVAVAAAQTPAPGLEGTWRGTLETGAGALRLVLRIEKSPDGLYTGLLDSVDQGSRIPIASVTMTGDAVKLAVAAVGGTFEGTLNAARTEIKGTWNQGAPLPLVFTRESSAAAPTGAAPAAPAATDASAPVTAARFPFGLPLDLLVTVAPVVFLGDDGRSYLVHELHVTNVSSRDFLIARVDVLAGQTTVAYEGAELNALMLARQGAQDRRIVAAGGRGIVFFFIPVEPGALPEAVAHRVTIGELNVTGAPVKVSVQKPIVIAPPLRGDGWRAGNGPGRESGHRRALIAVEGGAHIAQRFAIDWVKIGANGRTFSGDAKDNRSYLAYGVDALAVADATVAAVKDGIPENVPGPASRAVPITLETVGGNHVVLDLGGGRFAFYAHLQPGSLRVKAGERVKAGQVLGLVGNSGNSTEPHLHFHISNGISPLGSEGLPYAIAGKTGMPLQNSRVDFGR